MGFRQASIYTKGLAKNLNIDEETLIEAINKSLMGGYGRIWALSKQDKFTTVSYSTSKKSSDDNGTYETDFSEFVRFVGNAHDKLADIDAPEIEKGVSIKDAMTKFESATGEPFKGINIQIISANVDSKYVSSAKQKYTNYVVYDFKFADKDSKTVASTAKTEKKTTTTRKPKKSAASEAIENADDEELPF